jgi:hypothetical protein
LEGILFCALGLALVKSKHVRHETRRALSHASCHKTLRLMFTFNQRQAQRTKPNAFKFIRNVKSTPPFTSSFFLKKISNTEKYVSDAKFLGGDAPQYFSIVLGFVRFFSILQDFNVRWKILQNPKNPTNPNSIKTPPQYFS